MANDIVGSNRSLSINSVPFRVAADSNFERTISKYENTRIPTSGRSMRKMMARLLTVEGVDLIVNAAEIATLKTFAESLADAILSYTTAAGDEYQAVGSFELEKVDTESGKATLKLDPADDWVPFIA
jgi:outer membrane lipopolysaccharide assembly protein LptE/RlpB